MKYSRTAIGLLTAQYRSVLKKCLLINLGLFALGAVSATPANAAELTSTPAPASTWVDASSSITDFMDDLATETHGAWDRNNGEITGWGMDKILGALGGTDGVLAKTDAAVTKINTLVGNDGYLKNQVFLSDNASFSMIWNEQSAGGAMAYNNTSKNRVFAGVNGNNNDGMGEFVSLYAKKDGDTSVTKRIIMDTTGAYYVKSEDVTPANVRIAANEIATIGTAVNGSYDASETYTVGTIGAAIKGKLDGTSIAYDSGASGNTYYTAATINSNFATQTTVGTKLTGTALTEYEETPDATEFYNAAAVNGNFVKQVTGKGLSSNDFTNTYKTSLDNLATTYQTKLAAANAGNGISISDAQVISVNNGAGLAFDTDGQLIVDLDTVADGTDKHLMSTDQQTKLNNISTATTTSGDGYVTGELLGTTLNGYATTATASETANGLMSKENFSKLADIEANAEVNTIEGVQLNGTDLTLDANKKANIVAATSANIAATEAAASDSKLVTEKAVVAGLAGKQATLESGTNIKSINSQSVLGAGNLTLDDIGAQAKITSANPLSHELVSGLGTAATAAKSTETGITSTDAGLVTGAQVASMNYLTTETAASTYANLADGNQFTGNQQFGVPNGTGFTTKAAIGGNGSALFGRNDANTQYAFIVQKDGITANQSIAAKAGLIVGNGSAATELTGAKIKGYDAVAEAVNNATTGLAKKQAQLTAADGSNITLTDNGDGTVAISAKDTTYTEGNGISIDPDNANAISVDLADAGGLEIDNQNRLKAKIATTIEESNTDLVDSDLLAKQNYLKNGTNAKLTLSPTGNTADLAVMNGSNLVAGININGGDTNSIALTVNNDSNVKQAAIDINESGAFYTKTGTAAAADEIVTLGTAANGTYTNTAMTGVSTISGALDALQSSKQGNLTAGNGLEWDASTADKLNVKLKTFPTTGDTARPNGLALDADGLSVDLAANYVSPDPLDDDTINTWAATNAAKIATVGQTFNVLKDKMTIFQNDLFASNTTENSIAAALVGYVDPTTSPATTDIKTLQQAVQDTAGATADAGLTYDNTTQKLSLELDGLTADTNTSGLVVGENGLKVNKAATIAAAAENTYFDSATINSNFFNKANIIATTTEEPEADDNHVYSAAAADARFAALNGSDSQNFAADTLSAKTEVVTPKLTLGATGAQVSATSITKATSEASATEVALATAGYAQEQAKAAADKVVKVNGGVIGFYKSADAENPEATTYTAGAINTKLADKYNWSAIVGTTNADDPDQNEVISANTHVYSQDKSDELLDLKMNTADWTLASDATKLDGAKLGAGTVGFAAINPDAISTSASVAAILADSHSVAEAVEAASDTKLVTEKAVFAGVGAMFNDKQNWMSEVLGYDTAESIAAQLSPLGFEADASGHLGFLQAVSQNKTAIDNIISADTQLEGIQMSDNSATPVAKTVHKIDNSVIYDDNQATGDEDVLATKATVLAALDNPEQDITANKVTANEVDTKALKVAATKTGAAEPTEILTAGLDADENVLVTVNGKLSTGSLSTVSANITNLKMFNEDKSDIVLAKGIKTAVSDDGTDNYLITSGAVNNEFNTKVGTLTKNTGTSAEPVYTPVSVAEMIGVDANGALVFTEDTGVSNIASGDGSKSAPTTIVGAFENISSALGKIHGLAENSDDGVKVNNTQSIFANGDINSAVSGVTTKVGSNLKVGTSVEELEVSLDNAIGNIQAGNTVVGKAYADQFGNLIDTTYAKDDEVVHLANPETITGVKTFSNGLKVGADYKIDENGDGQLTIRDASNSKPVLLLDKAGQFNLYQFDSAANKNNPYLEASNGSLTLRADGKQYFEVQNGSLTLRESDGTNANKYLEANSTSFNIYQADGATSAFTVENATGNVTAKGNVQAAGLAFAGAPAVIATAIDAGSATDFNREATSKDAETLATLKSVDNLAEKATFTPATGGTLEKTTIGEAINELDAKKQAQLYYMDGSTKKPMNAEVKTTIAAAASAEDANLVTEKAIRTELDNLTEGVTKFNKLKLANNAATSADVQMLLVDDGNYSDELATTFATNLSVKSAVNKLVFGGNPNIWTGVNEFQNTLKVTKNNGSSFDTLFMVDNTSGNTTIASLKLGDYATAMNGIDLMPTLNSYNHLVTSGGVYDALQGTGTAGETINFGSRAEKTVIGQTAYNMTMDTKTGITTIGDGTTTGNIQMNKGALTAGTSVKVGSDSANSLMNASGLTVKNGDDNVAITSNSITLTDSGTSVFNVDQYGAITAGKASDAGQFSFDTHNGTASITTSKAPAISAAIAADGDSAAMEATDGTYDYLISANADMTTPADRGVVVGVTAAGQDKMLAGFEADNDSVGMGIADSNGDLVAGFSADKAAADQNIIEMGAFDNTNNKLDTGVSVDSKGKMVSIAAAGNEVVNVSYDTTKGKGLVGVTGDLTATGNFSADNAGFTVSHNDTTGKTDVVATGDVKAASLTLPNLDQTTAGATITATAIDNNATAFPTSGAGTTLATLSSIQNLAAQGAYTPGDQNSWRNPYAGDASTKPTTIAGALDRLATNLDAATNSLGDWSTLNAHVTASGYTGNGNITVTGTDPYKAPSAVSAVIDLDDAIGYRTLYNNTHYANTTGTAASVSQAIANMDTKVYEAIHGTGTPTAPDGKVFVGDAAKQIVIGNTKSDHKQYIRIDQESEKTLIGNTTFGETIDSINKVATIGGTNPNHYKMTLDGKNQKTTFGTPTNNITMEKGDLTATGDITATGELSAENGTFTVTNDGTKTTMALTGDAQINGDESVTGKITVQATGSNAKVEIDHAGTITATDGTETAHYNAAGITLNNGTADTFTVDTTNGDMMAAAGNFAVTTADGSATSLMSLTGDAVISGDTKTTTFTMPDAYQPTASSVQYAQVTSIDKGTTAANSFSDAALATTQSIKTKAENADYTASDALKAGNYATAQTSVATINNAIESLDLRIGDWDGLNLTPNGNLTNGHAGDAGYNEPETVVEAFNNIDSTLGRIHGLVTDNGNGTYTYNKSSGAVTQDWTNLAVGTTVEEHVLAVDTAIGNRNGYTAAYNINRGESVAESLNNIDLRLGDVKSLNNMNYYGEQNPNDVNLTGAVRALDNNLYRVEHDLKTLRHETHAGLASAAALSALVPNPRGTGDTTLSFGTGAYQGHTAAALGGFHWITNNLLVNAGVGWDNREATTRIGVSYSF